MMSDDKKGEDMGQVIQIDDAGIREQLGEMIHCRQCTDNEPGPLNGEISASQEPERPKRKKAESLALTTEASYFEIYPRSFFHRFFNVACPRESNSIECEDLLETRQVLEKK